MRRQRGQACAGESQAKPSGDDLQATARQIVASSIPNTFGHLQLCLFGPWYAFAPAQDVSVSVGRHALLSGVVPYDPDR